MTMLKTPMTFTANRLRDGEAVWLGTDGGWVETVNAALVLKNEHEKAAAQKIVDQADADNVVVEPYGIDVVVENGTVIPVRFREQIRAAGPTMRIDLGKQAAVTARAA